MVLLDAKLRGYLTSTAYLLNIVKYWAYRQNKLQKPTPPKGNLNYFSDHLHVYAEIQVPAPAPVPGFPALMNGSAAAATNANAMRALSLLGSGGGSPAGGNSIGGYRVTRKQKKRSKSSKSSKSRKSRKNQKRI